MALIEVRNIDAGYGETPEATATLEGVNFSVQPAETVSILGRSGVGKTTLCRIMAGLHVPWSGEVFLKGRRLTSPSTQIAISFQESPCFPWLTVAENVGFGLKRREQSLVEAILREVGLFEAKGKYPKELSGGMRQRVAIGRALAVQAACLILDEPFSALDMLTKDALQRLLKREQEERGFCLICVLHSLEDAMRISDRLIVLGGRPTGIRAEIKIPENPNYWELHDRVRAVLESDDAEYLETR